MELVTDLFQGFVEAAGLQRGAAARALQQGDDPGLHRLGRAGPQMFDDGHQGAGVQAKVPWSEGLALVHRHPADQLVQIFEGEQLRGQGFGLSQPALGVERPGPDRRLAKGLGIGRRPGQAVGHMLLGVQYPPVEAALAADAGDRRLLHLGDKGLGGVGGLGEPGGQVLQYHRPTIGEACRPSRRPVRLEKREFGSRP